MTVTNPGFEDRGAAVDGGDTLTGYVASAAVYPVAPLGAGTTLTISVDGGTAQTVTFAGGETTAAEVMHAINGQLSGGYSTSGSVPIVWTATAGPTGSIQVTGGTANATLLFSTTAVEGDDGGFEAGVLAHLVVPAGLTATLVAGARTGGGGSTVLDLTKTAGAGALAVRLPFPQMAGGRVYRITGWARGLDGLAAEVVDGVTTIYQGTAASTEWEAFDVTFVAAAGQLLFGVEAGAAANQHVQFDDVAISSVHRLGEPGPWKTSAFSGQGGAALFNDPEMWSLGVDDSGSGHLIANEASGVEQFKAGWDDVHLYLAALSSPTSYQFTSSSPSYASVLEGFEAWNGANWLDSPTVTDPSATTPPTLWHGAWWKQYPASELALDAEGFDEGWTTWGAAFRAPRQLNGVVRGDYIDPSTAPGSFTYEIGDNNKRLRLLVASGVSLQVIELVLTPGTYGHAALEAHLNAVLAAALGGSAAPWAFDLDAEGTDVRMSFGWDGVTDTSGVVNAAVFLDVDNDYYRKDLRFHAGFYNLGTRAEMNEVVYPGDAAPPIPAGWTADDRLLIDLWTGVVFSSDTDPLAATIEVFEGSGAGMLFDSAATAGIYYERFYIDIWFGAAWKSAYGPGDLTDFAWGGGFGGPFEDFVDTRWPSELYP